MAPQNELLSKAEDMADQAFRVSKPYLPFISRLCLVASFLDDGLRMISQWEEQSTLIGKSWNTGRWLGVAFVLMNMTVQFSCSVLILLGKFVQPSCYALITVVALQNIIYLEWFEMVLFFKSLGMVGGVVMLLVEARALPKPSTGGMLLEEKASTNDYLQMVARGLLAAMLLNMMSLNLTAHDICSNLFYLALLVLTVLGWKTKLCAIAFLLVSGCRLGLHYDFWNYEAAMSDYLKYKFFQTISCMGGYLLVLRLGPGFMSVDAMKKRE